MPACAVTNIMKSLFYSVLSSPAIININRKKLNVPGNTVLITKGAPEIINDSRAIMTECSVGQLVKECHAIYESRPFAKSPLNENGYKIIPLSDSAKYALIFFERFEKERIIPFLIYYTLSSEWIYFSDFYAAAINESGNIAGLLKNYVLKPWGVNKYAEILGLSTHKFNTIFREQYGMSPIRWIREERLKNAKELLKNTKIPVSEVAWSSGFSNQSYFSDSFRKRFGCTPTQWRDQLI